MDPFAKRMHPACNANKPIQASHLGENYINLLILLEPRHIEEVLSTLRRNDATPLSDYTPAFSFALEGAKPSKT